MKRKPRRWDYIFEDDPGGGLLNLFDVWIAFSVALLLALFGYLQNSVPQEASGDNAVAPMVKLDACWKALKGPRFRSTHAQLSGEGARLGMAYRLKNGEVVYVPEDAEPAKDNQR